MKKLLLQHLKELKELDKLFEETELKINKCRTLQIKNHYCSNNIIETLINEIELNISFLNRQVTRCIKNHKTVSKFIYNNFHEGKIPKDTIIKTENETLKLRNYSRKIDDMTYILNMELKGD